MNLTIEIQNEVDEDEWDRELAKSQNANPFQIGCYHKPYQIAFNSKLIFIKVLDKSGRIVGQLSAVLTLKEHRTISNSLSKFVINKFNLGSVLMWKMGPIIHDHENHSEIVSQILYAIDKLCLENKTEIIRGTTPPLDPNFSQKNFLDSKYSIKPWKNYIINLPIDPNDYFVSLHKKTRYDIKKGEKNGLTFEIAQDIGDFKEFLTMKFRDRKNREAILKQGWSGIEATWNILFKEGYRKLFLVRHKGDLIGGIFASVFNKNVTQTTVVNSSQRNLQGGSFLSWNAIKWAIENHNTIFDMSGANPFPETEKEKGIDFYKAKWNGTEYKTFIFSKILRKNRSKFLSLLRRF